MSFDGVRTVCELLDVGPDEMADVCKREAAQVLRRCAVALHSGGALEDGELARAEAWLTRADAFEAEWESSHPDFGNAEGGGSSPPLEGGDQARSSGEAPAASSEHSSEGGES